MKNCVTVLACGVLVACSTPQVVLQQASNGAQLTGEFSKAMASYEAQTKILDKERQQILLTSKASILQYHVLDINASQTFALAGQSQLSSMYDQLKNSSDTIAKAREDAKGAFQHEATL